MLLPSSMDTMMTTSKVDALLTGERKVLTFMIKEQVFGIDMEPLVEVREWDEPTAMPGVPSHVRGISNLRGTTLPIIDLSDRLGWGETQVHSRSCVVVVELSGRRAGFLVDQIADILPVREADVQPCPQIEVVEKQAIKGLVQLRQGSSETTLVLLDLAGLDVLGNMDLAA